MLGNLLINLRSDNGTSTEDMNRTAILLFMSDLRKSYCIVKTGTIGPKARTLELPLPERSVVSLFSFSGPVLHAAILVRVRYSSIKKIHVTKGCIFPNTQGRQTLKRKFMP